MGRKLRHVLVFLLIILKEPNMPEAVCRCKSSLYCKQGLTSIPQNLPTSISDLNLKCNRIKTVRHSELLRYKNLVKVNLSYNQITTIHPGSFANLPELQELFLYQNQIRMIQPGTLDNLPELKILNLGKNRITTVQIGKFENLPRLQELFLIKNRITTIQPGTLVNLPQLQKLYLSYNLITKIESGTFENLPKLQTLYLSSNQITMIQPGLFVNLPQLSVLFLDRNNMVQAGTFANLPELQKLYLHRNQLTMIQPGAFANLPELERLHLDHNQITMIESHAFANIPKLRHLDLRSNRMFSIHPSAYGLSTSILTVALGENPWQCDCRMAPVRLIPAFNDQIICAQPANFQGQKLKDINPEELICEGPTTPTPHVDVQNTFVSTAMSKSSSYRKTEINPGPTACPVASPFATTSTFPPLPFSTQKKVAPSKPKITRHSSHESSPSVSIPALIGSVCGTAGLSIVAAVLITIWCKRNTKNPPSGPTSNMALSNINTTATVPTSGSLHDQTGQGQSLASTQPSNIKHPSRVTVRGPAASQTDYYVDAGTPPNPKKTTSAVTGSLAPHRDGSPPRDDDEPTYVEPDGAHYMTPEDVLYEMPANSHCEDDNRHYYQPLKKEQNLPTDASGYILVVPNNPKGQC